MRPVGPCRTRGCAPGGSAAAHSGRGRWQCHSLPLQLSAHAPWRQCRCPWPWSAQRASPGTSVHCRNASGSGSAGASASGAVAIQIHGNCECCMYANSLVQSRIKFNGNLRALTPGPPAYVAVLVPEYVRQPAALRSAASQHHASSAAVTAHAQLPMPRQLELTKQLT